MKIFPSTFVRHPTPLPGASNFGKIMQSALLACGLLAAVPLPAATLYYDVNGSTVGFGVIGAGTYDWNTTDSFWNTDSDGSVGTFSAWSGASDVAVFTSPPVAGNDGYAIRLQNDVGVGGITMQNSTSSSGGGGSFAAGEGLTISGTSAQTIALNAGAVIDTSGIGGSARFLNFGDNVNLVGNVSLVGDARVSISGTGNDYSGTITVNGSGAGGLQADATHRIGSSTSLVVNSGQVTVAGGAALTVSGLSGTGGALGATTGGGGFVVNQSGTTNWGGTLGRPGGNSTALTFDFEKSGAGTLVLDTTTAHEIRGEVLVSGGSLYAKSDFTSTVGSPADTITINAGANFGGTSTVSKAFTLDSATSRVTPGMPNEAGVLTLANGISAVSGGIFDFKFNGANLLNSHITLTDGTLSLGGTLTANFYDLGTGTGIEAGVAYTIFEAAGITTAGWVVGDLPTGWTAGGNPFSVSGDALQITFGAIPEPSTGLLLLAGASALLLGRRVKRRV